MTGRRAPAGALMPAAFVAVILTGCANLPVGSALTPVLAEKTATRAGPGAGPPGGIVESEARTTRQGPTAEPQSVRPDSAVVAESAVLEP